MSKGLGSIQRHLLQIFDASPEEAFRVDELCWSIYGARGYFPTKSQRVAVIRAGKNLVSIRAALDWFFCTGPGRSLAFYNHLSVMSYARGWMKSQGQSNSDIEARLGVGGCDHEKIVEGGVWWLAVQAWVAEHHNDDTAKSALLQPTLDTKNKEREQAVVMLRALFGTGR